MLPLKDNISIRDFPVLTALLIVINILIFAVWQGGSRIDVDKVVLFGTIPYEVTHPGNQCVPARYGSFSCEPEKEMEARYGIHFPETWKTPFVSMFMHISWGHLIGNMLFLFVFGVALEAGLGQRSFLLFYVVGGLAATLGHTLFDPSSPLPSLGASGAISAVMGGYVMLYPRAKIFTWVIPPLPFVWGWIRAAWVVGILMFVQVISAYVMLSSAFGHGGGVAYFAHFGGFLAGVLLVLAVLDRQSIENLRRQARIASGDENPVSTPADIVPAQQTTAVEAQLVAAQQAAQHAAYAQRIQPQQVYAQQAYGGQAVAASDGKPMHVASPYPSSDPFAPPPERPPPPPPVPPATRNRATRPAPGSVPRPPGC